MNSSRIMNGRTTGALPIQNTKIDKVVPLVIDEFQRGPHVVSKGQEVRISLPANYSLSGFPRAVKITEKIEIPMGGPARKIITFKAISGDVKLSFKDPNRQTPYCSDLLRRKPTRLRRHKILTRSLERNLYGSSLTHSLLNAYSETIRIRTCRWKKFPPTMGRLVTW